MARILNLPDVSAGSVTSVIGLSDLPDAATVPNGSIRYVDDQSALYLVNDSTWEKVVIGPAAIFDTLTVDTLTVNVATYLKSNVVEIGDNILILNSEVTGAPTTNAGLEINRGSSNDAQFLWNETTDRWQLGIVGSLSNVLLFSDSTDNLPEGSSHLYYTTARANTDFDSRLATKSTANLSEGINLYYTQGRFDTAFAAKSTTNLSEGANLYYTAARFDTRLALKTTTDLTEGSNLYYTNARVLTAVSDGATQKVLYVAQDTGNDAYDGSISKPFKTIQAAINAAELLAAYYAPVIILVAPPTANGYVENLTFSQQGIVLQSMGGTYRHNMLVRGNVTVNLTGTSGGANYIAASNEIYIHGFTFFNGASGNTITFSGSTFQRLFIDDCYIDCTGVGNSALLMTNTGVNGVKSTISSRNTDWNNNTSTAPTIKVSAGRFFVSGPAPDVQNANTSGQSLLIDGASAAGPSVTMDKVALAGQVSVSDNTATLSLTFCSISSGSLAAIVSPSSASTGFIFLGSVGLTTTATNSITGSGIVVLSGLAKLSTGGDIVSTVTQSMIAGFPQGATMIGAGATQNTNTLLTIKNGHITSQQTTAPTSALQVGAGTTATRTLTRCTDTAGNISITTNGLAIAAGAQLIVTFNKAYATAPVVTISPANANAPVVQPYVTSSATTFTINFAVAGIATTVYNFTYQVMET